MRISERSGGSPGGSPRVKDRSCEDRRIGMNATSTLGATRSPRYNAPDPDPVESGRPLAAVMAEIGRRARGAARRLALASAAEKDAALRAIAARIRLRSDAILNANAADADAAKARGHASAFIDRLVLDGKRLAGVADAVASVADLTDPVGRVLATFTRPNGLVI